MSARDSSVWAALRLSNARFAIERAMRGERPAATDADTLADTFSGVAHCDVVLPVERITLESGGENYAWAGPDLGPRAMATGWAGFP